MKTRNIIIVIIIVVILSIAGIFIARKNSSKSTSTSISPTVPQDVVEAHFPTAGVYQNKTFGFQIKYDKNLDATATPPFAKTYLNLTSWNAFADTKRNTGIPLVDFVHKDSNDTLRAELRVGASKDAVDVSTCTDTHNNAQTRQFTINGVKFTQFSTAAEGTTNFNQMSSYRTVHNGACIALDMIITGSNIPSAASKNDTETSVAATTPFDQMQAWQDLAAAVNSITFTTSSGTK